MEVQLHRHMGTGFLTSALYILTTRVTTGVSGHIIIKYLVQLVLHVPSACALKQN